MDALTSHRLTELEEWRSEVEARVRTLEIGYARLVGWSAGGAAVGGAALQVVLWLLKG